jgi:nucleoprotein TPR
MKEDVRRHAELARNAQKQYQNELVAHAADVQALGEAKEQCQRLSDQLATCRSETVTAEAKLKSAETSWEEQRSILQRNISDLEDR